MERQNLGNHILPTAANLLGICFLIFSIARFQDKASATLLDEFAAIAMIAFLISCFFSYFSLRSKKGVLYEKIADISFLLGLLVMAIPSFMVAITYIQ